MQLLALPLRCRRGHENGGDHDLHRANQDQIKKVFLIDQDYSFGHSFAAAARQQLQAKAPGIEIVGDEFHPLQKIKDFAPYVDKIKAAGADSVITGDWGDDLALLTRAGAEGGLAVNWYTFYGDSERRGPPLGQKGVGRGARSRCGTRTSTARSSSIARRRSKRRYGADWSDAQVRPMMEMLARAIDTAGGARPAEGRSGARGHAA